MSKQETLFPDLENETEASTSDISNLIEIKEEASASSENINDKSIENEQENIESAMRNLGIIFSEDGKKDILNYSKTIAEFKRLLDTQKNIQSALGMIKEDEIVKNTVNQLNENWENIKNFFETLIKFFTNPPSKEIFELTNYSVLLTKVYDEYKKFQKNFEELNINEDFIKNKEIFENQLKNLENFSNSVDSKMEHLASKYDEFLSVFLKKQSEKLESFDKNSKELASVYTNFIKNNIKFMKGGLTSLIILSAFLCLGAGILFGLTYAKYGELKGIESINNQLDNIKIIQNDDKVIFEFPSNVKIIDDSDAKKIIISNQ